MEILCRGRIINLIMIFVASFSADFFGKSFAQGTGNHVTLSMQNITQPTANTIQFDLMAVSDGAASSDLRANSFQYGINYNTAILSPGGSITPSYVAGSSEFIPPLNNTFNFPISTSPDHIRIVQNAFGGNNTGITMVVGHTYKVGTFQLTGSQDWEAGSTPNFSLQSTVAIAKTICAEVVWIGTATNTTSFSVTGTGNGQRSLFVSGNITLPVELLSFNGVCSGNLVHLTWATASEINNDFFSIERSDDGMNFYSVSRVEGAGNSTSIREYEYTDKPETSESKRLWYYRLKQTDFDGQFKYSPVIRIKCSRDLGGLVFFPVPAGSELQVIGDELAGKKLTVDIYNMCGKKMYSHPFELEKTDRELKMNISSLSAGFYFIQLSDGENVYMGKVVKE